MNKIIIALALILGLSGNAAAQSKQQIQEISQLKSRIKNANEQIAETMLIYQFIIFLIHVSILSIKPMEDVLSLSKK